MFSIQTPMAVDVFPLVCLDNSPIPAEMSLSSPDILADNEGYMRPDNRRLLHRMDDSAWFS